MSVELGTISAVIGLLAIALHLPFLTSPSLSRGWLALYPRSVWAGRIVTAVALGWAAWLLYHATFLSGVEWAQRLILVLGPVAYVLLIVFMDELLAVRALGGLLLLAPSAMLDAAQWHESSLRYVITVLAYVWVVAGITLVLSPHYFRRVVNMAGRTDGRMRAAGVVGLVAGGFLLFLGLMVY